MKGQTRRTFLKVSGTVLGGVAAGTTVTAATRTDRFIVDTATVSVGELETAGLSVVSDLAAVNLAVVEGAKSDLESVTSAFEADVELSLSEPEGTAAAPDSASATDEPLYGLQWDKQSQDIPAVHDITRGEGTRVAIIDSGVAAGHPDLEHAVNLDLSKDFTGDGYGAGGPYGGDHGTHVAGIVAANDQNETGVVGSAPGTDVVDCRVFSQEGGASFADILDAIVYATQVGSDAANLSLGAYPVPRQALREFYGKALNRVMTYANSNGTLLVISVGNDAADLQHDANFISLPNEGAQALGVSATGPIGFGWGAEGLREPVESPAFYTNYGTNAVTLGAPGGDADLDAIGTDAAWYYDLVLNTVATVKTNPAGKVVGTDYDYGWKAGTSMAAPQVTAAAALVKSVNPSFNANEVEECLKETAVVPEGYDKTYYGSGLVNPLAAVRE